MKHTKSIYLRLSLALVVFLALLALAPAAQAQSKSVTVLRRDADITILDSGDVLVRETWEVQFHGGPFRFAFRSIPLNKVDAIVDWSVSENGQAYSRAYGDDEDPHTYTLDYENGERKITWYFPPTTEQTRTFNLNYTLEGGLALYQEGDQFFWKFIESDRGYTINASRVTVHLPVNVSPGEMTIASFRNTQETSDGTALDGQTVVFEGGSFPSGTEWEIGVSFPHGLVSAELPRWQVIEANQGFYNLVTVIVAIIVLIGGVLALYLMWYVAGRDKPAGVVPEYFPRPPEDVPPGVAGTLLDEMADMEDVLATLVDLARRGYLRIEEIEQAGIGAKGDFRFVRTKQIDAASLRPYEVELLRAVFKTRKERKLSNLKNKFYSSLPKIRKALYEEVTHLGYFPMNPEKVRGRYGCAGFLLLVVAGLAGFCLFSLLGEYSPLMLCVSLAVGLFPVGVMILGRYMPRKSAKGARSAAQWNAFKRYLENIEKYTSLETAAEQFDQYLPYAIAFGLEKSWVKKFERTNAPIPPWYYPYGHHGHHRPYHHGRGLARPVSSGQGGAPSLDSMAEGAFSGLDAMSTGLFTMLDSATNTFKSAPSSSGSGGYSGGGFSGGSAGGGGSSGFG